ncbi:MAG: beta-propeller domain-containing protein, partial [Aquihabitans sp.]
ANPSGGDGDRPGPGGGAQVNELLVSKGRVAIFGTEVEVSKPVAGDPSATQAATSFMTVTFVDATDPAQPKVTDRVRVEGSLVSARLVGGEIRLVTTSNMADLGFVMPTTPNSVSKALEQNRRSVASSTAPDWIPDWQRKGSAPEPLVPCERVYVPDTFSGVAMTSMVTFPLGSGRFQPAGTSILAPATTLYAGLDKVAISSEVWVDPIDRDRLEFKNWQTAIHEFSFADDAPPTYAGSGLVDGSTVGQFAFGEIGGSLAVVTTKGTPWNQNPTVGIDLTVLTPDGKGKLTQTAKIADLSNGKGEVTAVRFVEGRVLISTGLFGREVYVIDVTKPTEPRRAGSVSLPGMVGYFHPLPDHQALVIGSRNDQVGEGEKKQERSWVQAQLLDVSDADAPRVIGTWERPWVADQVGSDHHAFTYWPERKLGMWGLQNTQWELQDRANEALVLSTDGGVEPVAVPVASKPNETPSPCPAVAITDPEAEQMVGPGGVVLRCGDKALREIDWPRYRCSYLDSQTAAQYAPDESNAGAFFLCSPAPQPTVSRVLVVAGKPILLTDQTLEVLDPATFASTSVTYHPTTGGFVF